MVPSPSTLLAHLAHYDAILTLYSDQKGPSKDASNLADLDRWARQDLRPLVMGRKQGETGLTIQQMENVVKWKMARGKFRPTLLPLLRSNDASTVLSTTSKAISSLSNHLSSSSTPSYAAIEASLKVLCDLKGIGAATASAVLSLLFPRDVFMSDEVVKVIMGEKPKYSLPYYKKVWERVKALGDAEGNGKERGMEQWEMAAWASVAAPKVGYEVTTEVKGEDDMVKKVGEEGKKRKAVEIDEPQFKKAKATAGAERKAKIEQAVVQEGTQRRSTRIARTTTPR